MKKTPTCWKCGYELSGLAIDGNCPECGTDIWSAEPVVERSEDAKSAMIWGIVAIVTFFACLGPIAGFVAIPAILKANRAKAAVRTGRFSQDQIEGATTGLVLGWITAGLSMAVVGFYAIFFLIFVLGTLI
ncbi:MAG: hypothetical protein AAGI17_05850 [Planctomycetota bacterium]